MDQLTPNDGQIPDKKPAIVVLSASGLELARKIARTVDADIHGHAIRCPEADVSFVKARPHIAELFAAGRPIIGICAAGILIRSIAPYLQHKSRDAAVLAVSETGAHVVPLIGGHHGAITLGAQVTRALAATLAVTTAGNLQWNASLDEPPAGWKLANHASAGRVMPQLLAGDGAFLDGECAAELQDWLADVPRGDAVTLTATRRAVTPAENQLVYCPQDMMLGLGCARGCSVDELMDLVMSGLSAANINAATISCAVSVDIKAD
ncbi:MAG: precorrin-3B C(17)-methyltransferase, partial [Candidatus Puniceispirillaceae bacterium]